MEEYRNGAHVVFVPTPKRVVNRMLEFAGVKRGDLVYDLGCGDGRIVITAAKKYKARAVGFDIDPERVKESRANVEKAGMQNRVKIKEANMFKLNLRPADVITLYLYCETNMRLLPQLRKLKPGSRIVSHDFWIEGIKPKRVVEMQAEGRPRMIYLWETPLENAYEPGDAIVAPDPRRLLRRRRASQVYKKPHGVAASARKR